MRSLNFGIVIKILLLDVFFREMVQAFLASPSIQVSQKYMQCDLLRSIGAPELSTLEPKERGLRMHCPERMPVATPAGTEVRLSLFEIDSGLIFEND